MARQLTLDSGFDLQGVTIHSGVTTCMIFHPAPPDTGIIFRRTDVTPFEVIEANIGNVSKTERCTQLTNANDYSVSMVEHVLSALRSMGVDNAIIDVNGEEIPILDGSALPIAKKLVEVGLLEQNVERRYYRLKKIVRVESGRSFLEAAPDDGISYAIGFKNEHNHPFLSDQTVLFNVGIDDYHKDIAPARTFCFEKEVDDLKQRGLIQGVCFENALIISESGITPELRYQDELVRHKLLDVIGDLALLPPFFARIEGDRTSHRLNTLLAREMVNQLY